MTRRSKMTKLSSLLSELHVPLLILAAFLLGAGGMWVIMRSSAPGRPGTLPVARFSPSPATEPPDVSQLAPADAAKTLGDWNYDRHNWAHAIDHYQEAIADGADNPDVRTDLGNCFRFIGEPHRAPAISDCSDREPHAREQLVQSSGALCRSVTRRSTRSGNCTRISGALSTKRPGRSGPTIDFEAGGKRPIGR